VRFLILGAGGQLATTLSAALAGDEVLALSHAEADICDAASIERHVAAFRPDCLVNTAAFHRVDVCEEEIGKSFAVNSVALRAMAGVANAARAVLVHFSTDYVFDGARNKPYRETDVPNPLSIYAMSKLAGEQIVRRYAERYFLVRTCGLYGPSSGRGKGGNFVEAMLRLARSGSPIRVVSDQVVTPTSAEDLAEALVPLLHSRHYGLYHMTNAGECSWFDFAREIFRLAGLQPNLQPVSSAEFRAKASRPLYSVLDNAALRAAGYPDLRPWQEALADYLRQRPSD
jgi:dTDP-4-dehydrorhamnose reductase